MYVCMYVCMYVFSDHMSTASMVILLAKFASAGKKVQVAALNGFWDVFCVFLLQKVFFLNSADANFASRHTTDTPRLSSDHGELPHC